MPSSEIQPFFSWFQAQNGYIDTLAMDVVQLPPSEGGRGAIALIDIPENHVLFSVPRSLILSTRTSALPSKFGPAAWKRFKLHQGWAGLMLCMMWEAAQGAQSKWSAYLDMMPRKFDTPMFWSEAELEELKGTSVVDKLGKDQAEKDYAEKVVPAIQSRPDLFRQEDLATYYSLDAYHMMGTRILSRSFTLEPDEGDSDNEDQEQGKAPPESAADVGNTSIGSAMDVDQPTTSEKPAEAQESGHDHEADSGDEEDEDEEPRVEVAMVPLADILNARYKTDNVKLFHEPECLRMVSTKPIKAGEQIWNTYGDLPNAELLRGFGHVDYLPLPFAPGEYGNPGDVVEIRADIVVQCVLDALNGEATSKKLITSDFEERIDWWLEEGGDDTFTIEHPSADPDAPLSILLQSFIKLLLLTDAEFKKAQSKGRPPKPTADARNLRIVCDIFRKRKTLYATSLEDDLQTVKQTSLDATLGMEKVPSLNLRHALIVRIGEKRVLQDALNYASEMLQQAEKKEKEEKQDGRTGSSSGAGKRKADSGDGGAGKKRRK
ncbi:hypothetical protein D9613_000307 [Agrocybe pediades]|uniref:Ribosomal lysine N-methyltransferase 4 n=1 Tax=Agrocybe pediades TaxID=84607 RepID=A0A8H4R075_9AGAR|nr:hypothetical protein D9613_000307 [Agrocybe pediades]